MRVKARHAVSLSCLNCGTRIIPTPKELREWRKATGLNQRQMASHLRISAAYVAYLESGQRTPGMSTIARYWKFIRKTKRLFDFTMT